MKRSIIHPAVIALALPAIALLPACRSLPAIPGQWLDVGAAADGRPDDFSRKITSRLFENGMMVGIGNDDRYLYVLFSPDIQRRQRPAGRATLTVWLDGEGGKARKLGLVLVGGPTLRRDLEGRVTATEARPDEARGHRPATAGPQEPRSGREGQALLKVVDRRHGRETFLVADGSLGPAVRVASDWGDVSYQLRVPLQATAGGDWPGLRPAAGKAIGVGIIWKAADPPGPAKKDRAGRFPGGPGAGGGEEGMSPPPGGMAGGPGRGMPGQDAPRKRSVWLRTFLASR